MKTIILFAAVAAIGTGPVVESCGFLPRSAATFCNFRQHFGWIIPRD